MAQIHSRHVNGALVFYETHRARWIDAIGGSVAKVTEHFVNTPFDGADTPAACTVTLVEAGASETTVALKAGADAGSLLITTDSNENDGASIQWKGEAFKLASGKPCYFGCRMSIDEATQSDFIIGLCITDTTLLGGLSDGAYFRKADGSTTVSAVLEKDSTETTGTALTCDTSMHIYEILFDGTSVDFFVDGAAITRLAQTNLPDDEYLTPSIEFLTGAAASQIMEIDWLRVIQIN